MEHVNIINRIIQAEQDAQRLTGEAREKRERLPEDLREKRESLRSDLAARAQRRIEKVREQEQAQRDEQIAAMDERFRAEMDTMERLYADNRDGWVEKLFSMTVGNA